MQGEGNVSRVRKVQGAFAKDAVTSKNLPTSQVDPSHPSQRSLHNAPIFRLLLKVAVNGTHQCDLTNFCGALGSQQRGGEGERESREGGGKPS